AAEGAGIRQRATGSHQVGRLLGRFVPLRIGVIQAHFRASPEIRSCRRPGWRDGELGQLAGTFRRVYLVMAQFGNQLELLGTCIDRTHANRNPVLIAAALALVLLIHRLELAATARRHLPVEEFDHAPALVAATERDVAGIAETGPRPFAVLNSESVATAEEADLFVLHSNGPAAVGIALVQIGRAHV